MDTFITHHGLIVSLDPNSKLERSSTIKLTHIPNEQALKTIVDSSYKYAASKGKLYSLDSEVNNEHLEVQEIPIKYTPPRDLENIFEKSKELRLNCIIGRFLRKFKTLSELEDHLKSIKDMPAHIFIYHHEYYFPPEDLLKIKDCLNISYKEGELILEHFDIQGSFMFYAKNNTFKSFYQPSYDVPQAMLYYNIKNKRRKKEE